VASSTRKKKYVELPRLPTVPRLPEIGKGKAAGLALVRGPKGATIKAPTIQPQREDLDVWGFWLAAYPRSSFDEFLCYWGLRQLGLKMIGDPRREQAGNDFAFQKEYFRSGSFLEAGIFNATIVDFLVVDRYPSVGIFVDGLFWHKKSIEADIRKRSQLKQKTGITVVSITDVDIERDARYYVKEALEGRDHSHLRGRY
jgi:hypothetical protein